MSDSGRFYFTIGARTFVVEPIDSHAGKQVLWGDVDVVSKKLTGKYGNKNCGSVHPDDSIITEENGFKNISILPSGTSPISFIEELVKSGRS